MNTMLLKALLKIAVSGSPETPHTRPISPSQLANETGIDESELPNHLYQLRTEGLVSFVSTGSNTVTLTKSGVRKAKAL